MSNEQFHQVNFNDKHIYEKLSDEVIFPELDKQTINSYDFYLPLDTLISNSQTSRRPKKLRNKTPRPQNAWILYRKDRLARDAKVYRGWKACDISKDLGERWKNEDEITIEAFNALAKLAKHRHGIVNVGYKYIPLKKR